MPMPVIAAMKGPLFPACGIERQTGENVVFDEQRSELVAVAALVRAQRRDSRKSFAIVHRCLVIELSFGWLNNFRCPIKGYQFRGDFSGACIDLATSLLLIERLTKLQGLPVHPLTIARAFC